MATSPATKPLQNIETPKQIRIIGVPLDLGQSRRGVDMGPSAVRVAGLEAKLEALGYQVKDSGNNTATQGFSITVGPALSINAATLPSGIAGTAYQGATLTATGGTGTGYSFSLFNNTTLLVNAPKAENTPKNNHVYE